MKLSDIREHDEQQERLDESLKSAGKLIKDVMKVVSGGFVGADEADIKRWEDAVKELKRAQKVAVREYEKHFMTKETKTPATIRGLHTLNMKFVEPIEKLEKNIKRARK